MIRLLALVLPLCLDTFAVAAALGVAGPSAGRRVRIGLVFAAFEGGMPLAGLLAGAALGRAIGSWADWVAIVALAAVGVHMLLSDDEAGAGERLAGARGSALLVLGLSVSLDELAIGFTLGLLRVPIVPALAVIAAQAFVATQAGLALGRRIGERVREGAERVAAVALIVLAGLLAAGRLLGWG